LRGLLAEFGIIILQGISKLFQQLPALMEDAEGIDNLTRRHAIDMK